MPYVYILKLGSGEEERVVAANHRSPENGSWISLLNEEKEVIAKFNGLTGWRRVEQE